MFEFKASQIPRNEAYLGYAAVTRDEAQRRNRTFYEAISIESKIDLPRRKKARWKACPFPPEKLNPNAGMEEAL